MMPAYADILSKMTYEKMIGYAEPYNRVDEMKPLIGFLRWEDVNVIIIEVIGYLKGGEMVVEAEEVEIEDEETLADSVEVLEAEEE